MKAKKTMRFVLVFAVLAAFSSITLGMMSPRGEIIKAVEALGEEDSVYVHFTDNAFDSKVLNFLKVEKVCALDSEQAVEITKLYEYETHTFGVGEESVNVLYLKGNPLNKEIIVSQVGNMTPEQCQVVHGNKMVAVISPIFVS